MSVCIEIKSSSFCKVERFENITKSRNDQRLYRGIKLHNDMKIILISDPITTKSAASLVIGGLNDSKELPGLAHFLEHMVLLGSKKYPQENEYRKYVSDHGGYINAFTTDSMTNFLFDIDPGFLAPALDRFAQFFLEPLMDASATDREVMAVNSENEMISSQNLPRIRQVEKYMCKENHPYNNFLCGNLETLDTVPKSRGIDMRSELLKFHSTWYSSNMMCLAVLGRENLDDLEKMVVSLFEKVENKNVPKVTYEEHPYGPRLLKQKIYLVPVGVVNCLKICFATPDFLNQYKAAPDLYVSQLIGCKGSGSLHSVLQEKGLCTDLYGEWSSTAPGFGFYVIAIELTEEAVSRVDEILTLVFQFINFLRNEGIQEWFFEEQKKLGEILFSFKDKESSLSYVAEIASSMNKYPMEDVLSCYYLNIEWEPLSITKLLQYLSPDNMNVIIVSKSFENIADQTERWYGTKYKVVTIPEHLIQNWRTINASSEFKFPVPNEFIPQNFDLFPFGENEPNNPYVIHESSLSRFWFKQDKEFKLPKLEIYFEVCSPVSCIDPCNRNLTKMMVLLWEDLLKEYLFAAEMTGFEYNIAQTKFGVRVG